MDGESNSMAPPESTVAQNFAADLDDMFGLGTIATLSQTVEEKKASVSSGQSELEQLEARLRETEQRLAKVSRQNSPSRPAQGGGADDATTPQKHTSPLAQKPTYPDDRPPTARRPQSRRDEAEEKTQHMPGAVPDSGVMPESQGQVNGKDDYVMVENRTS